jgi:hypothetical protein
MTVHQKLDQAGAKLATKQPLFPPEPGEVEVSFEQRYAEMKERQHREALEAQERRNRLLDEREAARGPFVRSEEDQRLDQVYREALHKRQGVQGQPDALNDPATGEILESAAAIIPAPDDPIVEHALHYAARGWHVFPAPPGEKKSHKSAKHSDGRKWGQTKDADEIRRDFKKWPDANIGVVCGAVSGIFVVEADTKEGHDVDGIASLTALEVEHGALPPTRQAMSPSGSVHYYFNHPGFKIKNSASAIAPGVDVRGDGGMVIAPPSVKPGKGVYKWRNNDPIADAPQWLLDRIAAGKETIEPEPELSISQRAAALVRPPGAPPDFNTARPQRDAFDDIADEVRRHGNGSSYIDAALQGEYDAVARAPKGERNKQLNNSSLKLGHYVGGDVLDEQKVIDTMMDACKANGLLNDGKDQCLATIRSGLEKGKTEPEGIPERKTADVIQMPGTLPAPTSFPARIFSLASFRLTI